MATKKKAAKKARKAKRYSDSEKQEIINFVQSYNAENGRGGVSQAVKKFGASPISINSWIDGGGGGGTRRSGGRIPRDRDKVLGELAKVLKQIDATKNELNQLEARFAKLKGAL